jgi:hypothetical protein
MQVLGRCKLFPRAGRPRYCLAAAFSSLKKYAAHPIAIGFFNSACGVTEEKEAAPAVAGVNAEKYSLKSFILRYCFNA